MEQYNRKKLDVSMHTLAEPNMRVMRGKALLDDEASDFKFVENEPRGPRSVEVGRTAHSRFVRRPDGMYTVTFRCDASTKYLREALTAEVAEIVKMITADKKAQDYGRKQEEKAARTSEKEETERETEDRRKGEKKKGDAHTAG
jgi:hypothetical protein